MTFSSAVEAQVVLPPTRAAARLKELLDVIESNSGQRASAFVRDMDPTLQRRVGHEALMTQLERATDRGAHRTIVAIDESADTTIRVQTLANAGVVERIQLWTSTGAPHRIVDLQIGTWRGLPVPAAMAADQSSSAKADRLGRYLRIIESYGFSGAALVVDRGQVLLRGGAGHANRASAIPNTPETVFSTGSVTKQFTAAAILKLQMMGRLRTSDRISRFLPDVPVDKAAITIRQLMTHTSGLPGGPGNGVEPSRDAEVKRILELPLVTPPGAEMEYSNEGYSLLAAIVELASTRRFDTFVAEELFAPAHMRFTGYRMPAVPASRIARAYAGDDDAGRESRAQVPNWRSMGNGEILSTVDDMYRWYRALRDSAVLSAGAVREMFTPGLNDYAAGWEVTQTTAGRRIGHDGGSTPGNAADIRFYPERDLFIVAFANVNGIDRLLGATRRTLEAIALGADVPQIPRATAMRASQLASMSGTYVRSRQTGLRVDANRAGLLVYPIGDSATALLVNGALSPPADWATRGNALRHAIDVAMRGQPTPELDGALNRRGELRLILDSLLRRSSRRLGRYVSTDYSESRPGRIPEALVSTLVLTFERGADSLSLVTIGGAIVAIGGPPPQPVRLVATSDGRFAHLDWGTGVALTATASRGAGGTVTALILGTSPTSVSFLRKRPSAR